MNPGGGVRTATTAFAYRALRDRIFGFVRKEGKVVSVEESPANIMERALLLVLVEFAPNIEPSTIMLAKALGTSERQVRRLLVSATAKGLLRIEHRTGQRSRYVITLADPGLSVPPTPDSQSSPDAASPRTNRPQTPDLLSADPGLIVPQSRQPSRQPSRQERGQHSLPLVADLPSPHRERTAAKAKRIKGARTSETPIPDDWQPSAAHRQFAAKHDLDLELEVVKFRGRVERDALKYTNWNGAFHTHLAQAVTFARRDAANGRLRQTGSARAIPRELFNTDTTGAFE